MPIQEILQLGNPRLRELSETVNDATAPEITALIRDLRDTLAHWRETTGYGRGIAAPQIGVPRRVIFLDVDRETPWPLINPTIVETSAETMVVWDGCLSFLAVFCQVERQSWIEVRYQDPAASGASYARRAISPSYSNTRSTTWTAC